MNSVQTKPIRVLVADDEADIRESYREILGSPTLAPAANRMADLRSRLFNQAPQNQVEDEFELTLCAGAEEALQAVENALADQQPYAVVFLDMRMPPGPDGLWAAIHIRAADPRVDIVIASAYSDIDPEDICRQVPPKGSLFYLQKPFHPHEIRQMAVALGRRRQAEERLECLAYLDEVTGLPSRVYFKERLERTIAEHAAERRIFALMFMDLDNFKRINDTLGHSAGDAFLREVAKRLLLNLRSSDVVSLSAGCGDGLARLGGDEFTVLLADLSSPAAAGQVGQRLLKALAEPIEFCDHAIAVTASVGIAVYPNDGEDAETLISCADLAMYFAKQHGKNNCKYFAPEMNAGAVRRLAIERELRDAVGRGEFSLNYQPLQVLASGAVGGLEALLRWRNVVLGSVAPAEFIPVAEETGMIHAIGDWVLQATCAQVMAWRAQGIGVPRVSINISVLQLLHDDFAERVRAIVSQSGVEPAALEFELSEDLLLKEDGAVLEVLKQIKDFGISLAIDDFGTGYVNLRQLRDFPVDRLKIDRAFVCSSRNDLHIQAVTAAILAMADGLRVKIVAEGIETEEQLDFFKTCRCDELQGFIYSRPLEPAAMAAFLAAPASLAQTAPPNAEGAGPVRPRALGTAAPPRGLTELDGESG